VPDDCQVVRDEEIGELEVALQLLHQIDDLRLDRDIQGGHWLVADEEVRVQRERAGQADPLPLARRRTHAGSARLHRPAIRRSAGARAPGCRSLPAATVDAQRLADHAPDRVAWVQGRVGILEDHLHPLAQRTQLPLAEVRDVGAVEDDLAPGRLVQTQEGAADR
jgi:hypothetical protein